MDDSFEWQSEEEWEQERPLSPAPLSASGRRRWPFVVPLLLLAAVITVALYARLNRQVAERTQAATTDVLHSHALLETAARQQDGELVRLLIDDADPAWLETQSALLAMGPLWERLPLGLAAFDEPPEVTAVTLSADLEQAELLLEQYYRLPGDEVAEARLQYAAHYQWRDGRWLRVPPPAGYWGAWQSSRGRRLLMAYPERDAAVGERLARDLDGVLNRACQELDLDCPPDLQLRLRLDTEAQTLLRWFQEHGYASGEGASGRGASGESASERGARSEWEVVYLSGAGEIVLPAPGLLGVPLDAAAYQALYRAYAVPLVTALITDQVGWVCCGQAAFFHALLARQLSQLGLRPWPLGHSHYERMLSDPPELQQLSAHWFHEVPANPATDDGWQPYTLVDFALDVAPELSLADRQRELGRERGYLRWALYALGQPATLRQLDRDLLRFAAHQVNLAQAGRPVTLPEHEIHFVCSRPAPSTIIQDDAIIRPEPFSLMRYLPAGETWLPGPELGLSGEESRNVTIWATPLPPRSGLLLHVNLWHTAGEIQLRYYLWQGDRVRLLYDDGIIELGSGFGYWASMPDPLARFMVKQIVPAGRSAGGFELLDTTDCQSGTCRAYPLAGWPDWSPDGRHTLVTVRADQDSSFLYLADARGQSGRLVADSGAAWWLDNESYAFALHSPEPVLYLATVAGDEPRLLLRLPDLAALLPGDLSSEGSAFFRQVLAYPNEGDWLFIHLSAGADYLIRHNRRSGEAQLLAAIDEPGQVIGLALSPDGRWLVARHWDLEATSWLAQLYLYDLSGAAGTRILADKPGWFFGNLWSPDGRWLMMLNDHALLTLYAPAEDYRHVQVLDRPDCRYAAWAGAGPDTGSKD
jgi:hypothetical protein